MNLVSDIPLVQQIISLCKSHNLHQIVISPGSRNAPLVLSFSNDSFFECYSIVDERCAAFFGLGIAQQTGRPVALVCTSGSALLNYYPAISEAFYSNIPLVVFSADRPKEHIDIGDGQTIRQENVFKNHICFEANLVNQTNYGAQLYVKNEQLINKALSSSTLKMGPVHINIPLYEPLYNTVTKKIDVPIISPKSNKENIELTDTFIQQWEASPKKMVLVGVLAPNTIESQVLNQFLEDPTVLVLTETTSNLYHPKIIPNIDRLIAELSLPEKQELQPNLLLTIGGLVISKKIKFYLRTFKPKSHIHVSNNVAYNTFGCLESHYKASANSFLKVVNGLTITEAKSSYQKYWLTFHDKLKEGHKKYLQQIPYSDLLVFKYIIDQMPKKLHLQLSNSSTIRYSQLFQLPQQTDVYCNRGTSGIDGSTSTAIGAATQQKKETLLITGDLSFFYDSNALWNNYIPNQFKIIVINNGGGGIFRILPGDKEAQYFETYLETTHKLSAKQLAHMYNFNYLFADESNITQQLGVFFKETTNVILEVSTPRRINDVVLLNYFKKIRE